MSPPIDATEHRYLLTLYAACRTWVRATGGMDEDTALANIFEATEVARGYIDGPDDHELPVSRTVDERDAATHESVMQAWRAKR